jgi:hypothetical protein
MRSNTFGETTNNIFHKLCGYSVGDVQETEDAVFIRFDKQVENVIISAEIMLKDDGIYIAEDYVLDILPQETAVNNACDG